MYLWRKTAEPRWCEMHEESLRARFGSALAFISQPKRKRLQIEIVRGSRNEARDLVAEFGGSARKLPRDWLKRFQRQAKTKPLKIGNRLVVSRNDGFQAAAALRKAPLLLIPAGTAFGTGDHATTAMSLRFLEKITRKSKPDLVVDLGTGSGILALASSRFGACRTLGLDIDPTAISTAKENARRNKIGNVEFRLGDVRRWRFPRRIDIVTANLFSELLIEILPRLKRSGWLILSGILRVQEKKFVRALRRNKIEIVEVRRRGKWIALLARQLQRA